MNEYYGGSPNPSQGTSTQYSGTAMATGGTVYLEGGLPTHCKLCGKPLNVYTDKLGGEPLTYGITLVHLACAHEKWSKEAKD